MVLFMSDQCWNTTQRMEVMINMKHRRVDKIESRYEDGKWIVGCHLDGCYEDVFVYECDNFMDYSYIKLFKPALAEMSKFLDRNWKYDI